MTGLDTTGAIVQNQFGLYCAFQKVITVSMSLKIVISGNLSADLPNWADQTGDVKLIGSARQRYGDWPIKSYVQHAQILSAPCEK